MDIMKEFLDLINVKKKIVFLQNLKMGYNAGSAFSKVINTLGDEKLAVLLNSGKPLSYSLFITNRINELERNILKSFEKTGNITAGLESIIVMNNEKTEFAMDAVKHCGYPVFLALIFIMIQFSANVFVNGITFGNIFVLFKSLIMFCVFLIVLFLVFKSFFSKDMNLIYKIEVLHNFVKGGISFEEIKLYFKDKYSKNFSDLCKKIDGFSNEYVSIISAGEISGEFEKTCKVVLNQIKEKTKLKFKYVGTVIGFVIYFLITIIIIMSIFSTVNNVLI